MPERALDGIKVVELGDFISAPLCAKLMADLGAEVVKVERPKIGDESRRFGPFPKDVPNLEKSGLFIYLNSNKYSVTLDLSTATGADVFKALIADADVLVENTPAGALAELGLDYDTLSQVNPRLVMTSISVFGRTGSYAKYKGYDLTAWHGSGLAHRWCGDPDKEPLRGAWYHADHWGGISGATATMLALAARDCSREGQHVDVSETDMLACQIMGYQLVTLYHLTGEAIARSGDVYRGGAPVGLLECKDGFFYIMALEDHHWKGTVRAMGSPEWAINPMFDVPTWERGQYGDAILTLMEPWLLEHTKEEIFAAFQAERVPVGPVYTTGELLGHPHLKARGFFTEIDHPAVGRVTVPGKPYNMTETPWSLRMPAPALGQHNQLILGGRLGFSNVDLTDMRRTGII